VVIFAGFMEEAGEGRYTGRIRGINDVGVRIE
jgi:hypothetical protein